MRVVIVLLMSLFASVATAGEWVTIDSKDILQIELPQTGAFSFNGFF